MVGPDIGSRVVAVEGWIMMHDMSPPKAKKTKNQSQLIDNLDQIPAVRSYRLRIGAELRGLYSIVIYKAGRTNADRQYKRDVAVIKFDHKTGLVLDPKKKIPEEFLPDPTEQAAITEQWKVANFPERITVPNIGRPSLPDKLKSEKDSAIFKFLDESGKNILMLDHRDVETGAKGAPWTFYSDGKWRSLEPEGLQPLFGLEQLRNYSTVCLHEGPKKARYCQKLPKDHPWANDLKGVAHLAWRGGAHSAHRTDFSPLNRAGLTAVYIIADHDEHGALA